MLFTKFMVLVEYLGLRRLKFRASRLCFNSILKTDRISIPVDRLDKKLSKYVVVMEKRLEINKLNDGRFQRTKQKVQTCGVDIVDDLIKTAWSVVNEGLPILKR